MQKKLASVFVAAACAAACQMAWAQAPAKPLDAIASDPVTLGWMVGSPPPPDKLVQWANGTFYSFPRLRWTFSHMRQMGPTTQIWRGDGNVNKLPRAERTAEIDALTFNVTGSGESMTWAQSLLANYTDGIVVLHKGKIVYERYAGALTANGQHASHSITKSVTGTLGEMLVADGTIDENAPVTKYVPELKDSGFGNATVRQVMDMTTGIKYSETYSDPKAEIWDHLRAGGVLPRPPGYAGPKNFYEFLLTVQPEGEHNQAFAYKTVNSDALGWIIRRATNKPMGDLISERIWSKLGAEQDAYINVDSVNTEFAGGGFNATARDLARFGEMMRNDGYYNGQQVLPKAVIANIRKGGDRAQFAKAGYALLPGWSYRDMWWVSHNEHGAYAARGIHGQTLYIDPKAEMVIARFGSHPIAANAGNDPTSLPAFHALAKFLMK